jgi:hypothetical protein
VSKLDINGTVTVASICGGYYDIAAGAKVVITDDSGKTLATTVLDSGLRFSAEVPTGRKFYVIKIATRSVVYQFSESEVRHAAITYSTNCNEN